MYGYIGYICLGSHGYYLLGGMMVLVGGGMGVK